MTAGAAGRNKDGVIRKWISYELWLERSMLLCVSGFVSFQFAHLGGNLNTQNMEHFGFN